MRKHGEVTFSIEADLWLVLLMAVVMILFLAGISRANTYTVNDTSDYGDDNIGDGSCHASSGGCTLRAALMNANHLGGSHTIYVPAGTYYIGQSAGGGGLDVQVGTTVNISGAGQANTVLDGTSVDEPILSVIGTATVTGMTFKNADSSWSAIRNEADLTLDSVTVSNNTTTNYGGGIHCLGSSTLSLTDSTISGNSAGLNGGGIYFEGVTATIEGSTISGNSTAGLGGGAVFYGSVAISNSTIDGNGAYMRGGGILVAQGTTSLSNTTVSNNTCIAQDSGDDGAGGGIYVNGGTTFSTFLSTITGNQASGAGGGIFAQGEADYSLAFSEVTGNLAASGGGIYSSGGTTGLFSVDNSTISGNTASVGVGGGIYTVSWDFRVTQSTISNNHATTVGGGLYTHYTAVAAPKLSMVNATVSGNTAEKDGGDSLFKEGALRTSLWRLRTVRSRIIPQTWTGTMTVTEAASRTPL